MTKKELALLFFTVSIFFIAGCGKKEPVPPSVPPMPMPHHISFDTSDGVKIYADYYQPAQPAPVLILLHMYGRTKETWEPVIPYLHKRGFAILNLDIRGHGDSTKQGDKTIRFSYPKNPDENMFLHAWKDVEAAVNYLKQNKSQRCLTDKTVLVGASIGCSISLYSGTKLECVKGAVLMSPGTNYLGVNSLEHINKFYPKPLLFITDEKEAKACESLINTGGYSVKDLFVFPKAGHGTMMFDSKSKMKVIKKIGNWLERFKE